MDSPAVQVNGVSRRFGSKTVLDRVSLSIGKGRIFGLIGPSGAGKTSLVKLMVGMDRADEGDIRVMDTRMPDLDLLQRIGYMSQSDALYAELTGEENLRFFASLFKLDRTRQAERIAYAAGLVNLEADLAKKVSAYSGGMKRRLSLAAALIQDPDLLILDEPTVGIDPELRRSIWRELERLRTAEGKTIVVTTHVMDEAERCDELAMIREGRVLAVGSPDAMMSAHGVNRLEDVFLLMGGMNR